MHSLPICSQCALQSMFIILASLVIRIVFIKYSTYYTVNLIFLNIFVGFFTHLFLVFFLRQNLNNLLQQCVLYPFDDEFAV